MRVATQQSTKQRQDSSKKARRAGRAANRQQQQEEISKEDLHKASSSRGKKSRLCGDLSRLKIHMDSVETGRKHPKTCVVCGDPTYSVCVLCGGKGLHYFPQKGKSAGRDCFIDYHNEAFFGLALDDSELINKRKKEWGPASITKRKHNARYIGNLKEDNDTQS